MNTKTYSHSTAKAEKVIPLVYNARQRAEALAGSPEAIEAKRYAAGAQAALDKWMTRPRDFEMSTEENQYAALSYLLGWADVAKLIED